MFAKNYTLTMPQLYPFWGVLEFEVITPDAIVLVLLPLQLFDGEAEVGKVGDVSGFNAMIGEFLLDGSGGPEVFALVLCGGLEDFREHQLWSGCLLELLVVTLDFLLVITGEPVDTVRILQLRNGMGEHLFVGDASAHVGLACDFDAEVAAGAVARG